MKHTAWRRRMSMSTSTNMSLTSKTDATDAAEASEPLLRRDDCDSITTLRLNRPRQFNALSDAMLDALQSALDTIAQDDKVRCVVLAAAGKAFCAGHDLREMHSQPDLAYYQALFARCSRVMQAIQALPVPVIAQAHGIATAADCQLVASYDLAIGSSSASFAVSGINAGLFCSTPAVALSRNISAKRAFDMLVTGRSIDAATALDWGLINDVVSDEELGGAVTRKAALIASKSGVAIRHGKALFYRQRQLAPADAYALAGDVMARNMMEEDAYEGLAAFLQKRAPVWTS